MAPTPTLQLGDDSGYLERVVLGLQPSFQLQLGTLGKPSDPSKGWAETLENGHCLKWL